MVPAIQLAFAVFGVCGGSPRSGWTFTHEQTLNITEYTEISSLPIIETRDNAGYFHVHQVYVIP